MGSRKLKLLKKIISGDANIAFRDVVAVAKAFGFRLSRINGSHHIFAHDDIPEVLNLQNKKGKAKGYQIRQLVILIEDHDLLREDDE